MTHSRNSGTVFYYEYPPTPSSASSTPPASVGPAALLRRVPIQRALTAATSESHSLVIAKCTILSHQCLSNFISACIPATPLELLQSTYAADFGDLVASILFSDMTFETSDGRIST